ncbi:MAG: glutamate--tRNA ligase family protein, partial [Pseudomonadota bacterium]
AWDRPTYAHIPLIHGPDGAKLSKRHGALGIEAYREMGYLPAGLRNYLVRLGWSHGDDELFSDAEAIAWFDLGGLNKAPARLDLEKLAHVNAHHLRSLTTGQLTDLLFAEISRSGSNPDEWPDLCDQIARLAPNLQERSKTTPELLENTKFLMQKRPLIIAPKMQKHLSEETRTLIKDLMEEFSRLREWDRDPLDDALAAFCSERDLKVGKIAPALRAALTGGLPAPSIADVLYGLGRDEALARLTDQAA